MYVGHIVKLLKGRTMKDYSEYVMVTNWEKVDADDFYLSDEWSENPDGQKRAKELLAEDELFLAYTVSAVSYVIYHQMDANQIFIDRDGNEIMSCEGCIIGNKHEERFEYSY